MREGGRVVEVGKDEIEAVVGSNMISLCPLPPLLPEGTSVPCARCSPACPPRVGWMGRRTMGSLPSTWRQPRPCCST